MILRIKRLALLFCLASLASAAVVVRDHATGAEIASPFLLPDVGVNDSESVALDIVNTGSVAVTVHSAMVSGLYYSLCCSSGFVLQPNETQALTLTFAPTQTGYFSGALEIDATAIFIFARSLAAPTLFVGSGSALVQASSSAPNVITEESGFTGSLPCTLINNSGSPVTVSVITATGDWTLAGAPGLPLSLGVGAQTTFALVSRNAPGTAALAGVVQIDSRAYAIQAHPPSPAIHIIVPSGPQQSGQQLTLSLAFDSAPTQALTGSLSMSLETQQPVTLSDPAILFPSTGTATASFSSVPGTTNAVFGSQTSLTFQTGTTAGTLHVTAAWGFSFAAVDIPITASPIAVESLQAAKSSNSLDVTVTGFDNTRTAGRFSFSFFDSAGAFIGNSVAADFTQNFYDFFFGADASGGGMFTMTVHFPVSGGTGSIASVQADLTNTAGDTKTAVVRFP